MTIEIKVPDIGDFDGVEIIEVLVKEGDTVATEQSIITVESDKASMEIPCPQGGVIKQLLVKLGDKVSKGTPMLLLEAAGDSAPAAAPAPQASAPQPAPAAPAVQAVSAPVAAPVVASIAPAAAVEAHDPSVPVLSAPHASPSVRSFARELGVDLRKLTGSGPKGRITSDDVRNYVKAAVAGVGSRSESGARAGGGGGLTCCPGPKWTSQNLVPPKSWSCPASRSCRAPTCTATGS